MSHPDAAKQQDTKAPEKAARAWRANLPAEFRLRFDTKGVLLFAVSAGFYVLGFLGAFLLPFLWLRLSALLTMPLAIGALFVLGHDACHGTLVRWGWLNRLLGRISLLPALHPCTSWVHAHNSMHHGWTNFKGRHPDFPPFSKAEFDSLPWWRRSLERVYRSWMGIGLNYTIGFYLKHLIFPRPEHRSPYRIAFHLDRALVAVFLAGQVTAACLLTSVALHDRLFPPLAHALFTVAFPWLLWISFMGVISYIQHTHPRLPWYDKEDEWSFYHAQLKSTVHVVFPWPIERLLHNIMDHPAHHIDPTIPLYHLPQSQRLLENTYPEHAVVVHWSLTDFFRTCAVCKLYDFDRHCWLNFAGEPTTPPGLCSPQPRQEMGWSQGSRSNQGTMAS